MSLARALANAMSGGRAYAASGSAPASGASAAPGAGSGPAPAGFDLRRDAFGRLVLTTAAGSAHTGVVPVRAFPIAAPDEGIALMGADGHELAWVERLSAVPAAAAELIAQELAQRDFMPEIQRIRSVSSLATPSTWDVQTDRGDTLLVLRGEEHIRRLGPCELLIADQHGVQFRVRDLRELDRASRVLLDRFL